MILKKLILSPNNREISFNRGLNIVIGTHSKDNLDSETTNGVGKSLLGRILNYCLGSKDEYLEDAFDNEFKENYQNCTLIFEIDHIYQIIKYITGNKKMETSFIDDKYIKSSKYSDYLKKLLFYDDSPTFRGLVRYFFRNQNEFNDYIIKSENTFYDSKYVLYLMNVDISYMEKKQEFIKTIKSLEDDKKYFKNRLKSEDNKLAIKNIQDEIEELENSLKEYKISVEYEKEMDNLNTAEIEHKNLINELGNLQYKRKQAKDFLNSLIKDNMTTEYIENIYEEINFRFPNEIKKELKLVEDFHKNLYNNRKNRLTNIIKETDSKINAVENKLLNIQRIIDNLTRNIDESGIMQEYSSIRNVLENKRIELKELEKNKREIENIESDIEKNEKKFNQFLKELEEYTELMAIEIKKFSEEFRSKLTSIYKQPDGMITLKSNLSDQAQTSFDLDIEVLHDSSDGRKQVGIFIFDWLLLIFGKHKINCLYHDNRLYQAVDSKICAKMIEIANDWCIEHNKQYILCLDDDKYNAIINDRPDLKELINNSIILNLQDNKEKDGKNKLLGRNIIIREKRRKK